jgi:hypothetical protein
MGASTLHSTDHLTVTLTIIKTALLIQVGWSWPSAADIVDLN